MKPTLLLTFLAIFSPGVLHFTNPVFIKGHLKNSLQNQSIEIAFDWLQVMVKADGKIMDTACPDANGQFDLSFVVGEEKSFDFFCYGLGVDTILVASLKEFESDVLEMTFNVPAKRKTNMLGQVLCPKCNRTDRVFEIAYGDGLSAKMEVSKSGDTTYTHLMNGKYISGGCEGGIARHYCNRDKVKF